MHKNNYPLFYSLKVRTALLYTGLLSCSFAVIFAVVYVSLCLEYQRAADRRLHVIFSECEYEYLTGKEFDPQLRPFRELSSLPGPDTPRIREALKGFHPYTGFQYTENRTRYVLFGMRGEEYWKADFNTETDSISQQQFTPANSWIILSEEFSGESYGERNRIYFLLLDKNRKLLKKSPSVRKSRAVFLQHPYDMTETDSVRFSELTDPRGRRIRLAYRPQPDGKVLVVGLSLRNSDENLEKVANVFLTAGLIILILSSLCGWLLAKRMIRGIQRIGKAADRIADGDYTQRVPFGNDGLEIDNLVESFNSMTANTETLMRELRTIADDIAHDLRTPLTRMLGRAEITVSGNPTLENCLNTLGDNAEECRGMLSLINRMLDISKTESGTAVLHKKTFDLTLLLQRSAEVFSMVTEQKKQKLVIELPPGPVLFFADPVKIQQMAANLLDNAVKFTPEGGVIRISLTQTGDEICFSVADSGCGIPAEEQKNVFKRFYRADSSRHLPGNGLGLALVHAIVHAHRGSIELDSTPGHGSVFTIRFPAEKPEQK